MFVKSNHLKRPIFGFFIAFTALILSASMASAQTTVQADDYPSIQDAIVDAGCGGTVLLSEKTYAEQFRALCSVHVIGAGIDKTIIDSTGLYDGFHPAAVFGPNPFCDPTGVNSLCDTLPPTAAAPCHASCPASGITNITDAYEFASLTLKTTATPNHILPYIGVGVGWSQNTNLHDLKVLGYEIGIDTTDSLDANIQNITILGDNSGASACIEIDPGFMHSPERPQQEGFKISNNNLSTCFSGIFAQTLVDSSIDHNVIQQTGRAVNLLGTKELDVHHNILGPSVVSGVALRNTSDLSLQHNTICQNGIGVQYRASSLIFAGLGFPIPSTDNTVHHNAFIGNGVDFSGPELTASGNINFKNTSATGICPSPL